MIRQKVIFCGKGIKPKYKELDLYPQPAKTKSRRRGKKNKSTTTQMSLNYKNAQRYLHQLVKANFYIGGYRIDLTYNDEYLPKTIEDADRIVRNFIKKISRECKKRGLEPLKYIQVDEGKDGGRLHHHMIINDVLPREEIESMWCTGRGKNKKALGYCNVDKLQFTVKGIGGLVYYITKQMKGRQTEGQLCFDAAEGKELSLADLLVDDTDRKKRWKQSQNLIKPWERTRDNAMTRKEVETLSKLPENCEEIRKFVEKRIKGYEMDTFRREYNELTGWSFYATLHRKDEPQKEVQENHDENPASG